MLSKHYLFLGDISFNWICYFLLSYFYHQWTTKLFKKIDLLRFFLFNC